MEVAMTIVLKSWQSTNTSPYSFFGHLKHPTGTKCDRLNAQAERMALPSAYV